MSAELEQRLRDAFARLPKPTREATARARSDALTALGPTAARSRGALLLVAFAVAFVIGAGAAALAATGNLRVTIGAAQKATATIPTRLSVPAGSNGIAVVAGGKLWLATRGGLRIEGMPVSTAELSPRALYAVVGPGLPRRRVRRSPRAGRGLRPRRFDDPHVRYAPLRRPGSTGRVLAARQAFGRRRHERRRTDRKVGPRIRVRRL